MPTLIGNDIVELNTPRTRDRHRDERFVNRILAPAEQARLRSEADPEILLWRFWTAKEAAYKLARAADPKLVFSPSRIEINPEGNGRLTTPGLGEIKFRLSWTVTHDYIHCLANPTNKNRITRVAIEELPVILKSPIGLTQEELSSAKSEHSIAARILAKRLLLENGFVNAQVIRKLSPTRDLLPPAVVPYSSVGISLSHDGRWIAAAISVSSEPVLAWDSDPGPGTKNSEPHRNDPG